MKDKELLEKVDKLWKAVFGTRPHFTVDSDKVDIDSKISRLNTHISQVNARVLELQTGIKIGDIVQSNDNYDKGFSSFPQKAFICPSKLVNIEGNTAVLEPFCHCYPEPYSPGWDGKIRLHYCWIEKYPYKEIRCKNSLKNKEHDCQCYSWFCRKVFDSQGNLVGDMATCSVCQKFVCLNLVKELK